MRLSLLPQRTVELMGGVDRLLASQTVVLAGYERFPDGSVLLKTTESPKFPISGFPLIPHAFRELMPFGGQDIWFIYPREDQRLLRDTFVVYPVKWAEPSERELTLGELEVFVTFGRTLRLEDLKVFAIYLEDAMRAFGVDDFRIDECHPILIRNSCAKYYMDVRKKGQSLINWIALSLFRFGTEVRPRMRFGGIMIAPNELRLLQEWPESAKEWRYPITPL